MRQRGLWVLFAIGVMVVIPSQISAEPKNADPHTVFQWLQREHGFLHRYLAVVNQATHDYSYGYRTPRLLMPVTIDLFTGYRAWLHEAEDRCIYPALANHLNEEQKQGIRLLRAEEDEEAGSVKSWQRQLIQYEAGKKKLTGLADTIDYLGRLINRHIVLQEQRVFPLLDQLTPKEQATILKQLNAFERETLGATGRSRYEQLLSYIEGEIKAIARRVW